MPKLFSIKELQELREIIISDLDDSKSCIVICAGTACQASGSNDIIRSAKRYIIKEDLHDKVALKITGCHGFCEMGPFILTEPKRVFYHQVKPEDVPRIIDAVIADKYVEELLYTDPKTHEKYYKQDDIPFFKNQRRTIFGRNQQIDPIRIFDSIAKGGYKGLEKAFMGMTPEQVIREIKESGLRGRGGAGFPTGLKWELLAKQKSENGKYIVCNADEGDPGAYMDRSLLEGNPHIVIEGMIIGAFGTGATKGFVYVRNEYPLAIKHLVIALRQARELGLLGENILGTGFSFDIEIARGAGAFVCGEESALMRSIEGKVGEPRQRPPYPVQKGIYGKPTAINNVETWANIPLIIENGALEYAKVGTKGNSGTKIFSLVGKIKNTGLVEVPMGITIKEIVFNIGGGPVGKAKIKAVQTGGPSGGCIPVAKFGLPIDYDSLAEAGSIMGSGGMIVMDDETCMVDLAKYFMNFLKSESCGKCFTCRKGTQRMYEILEDISEGRGSMAHINLLEELALVVKDTTMCGLGQTASNPVLSTLRYFRDEYIEHAVKKRCPAGVCSRLVGAPCQNACPVGTESWRYIALIEKGDYAGAYQVIREPNPFPSVCARVCNHPCESKCRLGTTGEEPVAIRALKRFVTEHVDPSTFKPARHAKATEDSSKVAVIGAGPAGITAAHYLSLLGDKVAIFDAEEKPGGMLVSCIPEYRLPRKVLQKEIDALLDENITLKCNTALGRDITIDGLFKDGFAAIFLAMGSHMSWRLNLDGEDAEGIFPSMIFLKEYNLKGHSLAKGKVGIIGGGNSAIDAARVALRQKGVKDVTVLYRRTHNEMPAFEEEINAAIEEGINIRTLVTPVKLHIEKGHLTGVEFIRNELGEVDESGRRKPIPVKGSEFILPLDTLVVAIGEHPDSSFLSNMGIEIAKNGTILSNPDDLTTSREGVFAGGDAVTGSNTVINAIAAGKKAAEMIDRFIHGEELQKEPMAILPDVYIEPAKVSDEEPEEVIPRVVIPTIQAKHRKSSFEEVEKTITPKAAEVECKRCLRCDLEFTKKDDEKTEISEVGAISK